MKCSLLRSAVAFLSFASAGFIFADDFKSKVINDTNPELDLHVSSDQFLFIRNFTQEVDTGSPRGVVMAAVLPAGPTTNVLVAAVVDPNTNTPPEVINAIVIAGPANVSVTCSSGTNCFISFKKEGGN